MMDRLLYPGTRVKVFDWRLYEDDISTPLTLTMRDATVVQWYGMRSPYSGMIYPDLIDVEFDYKPGEVSHGHFSSAVEVL